MTLEISAKSIRKQILKILLEPSTLLIFLLSIIPTLRNVTYESFICRKENQMYEISIRGNAFLWHQVRFMVHALFAIGKREKEAKYIESLLDIQKESEKLSDIADQVPLILYECGYDNLTWQCEGKKEEILKSFRQTQFGSHGEYFERANNQNYNSLFGFAESKYIHQISS